MAAKAQCSDQPTTKNGQVDMTTFNGQKKKMKNLTESPKYKTVLAPNAPWPQPEPKIEPKKKGRKMGYKNPPPKLNLDGDFDFLAKTREQINKSKIAIQSRVRDVSTGRLKGSQRLAG